MKQDMIFWLILSAIFMLLLPWMAVTFIRGDGGMAACFILFYGLNPIYSVTAGAFAGKNWKRLWYLLAVSAILFLLGTWIFFDIGELAFILYAMVYLALGILAMSISVFFNNRIHVKTNS